MGDIAHVPGRKSGKIGKSSNTYGQELRVLRESRGITIQILIARLQLRGWDVGEDTISNIEMGRRILSDTELTLILGELGGTLSDLSWPPG